MHADVGDAPGRPDQARSSCPRSGRGENLADMLQTGAAISSGDSGGPLVNLHRQVIGINTAAAATSSGVNAQSIQLVVRLGHSERPLAT